MKLLLPLLLALAGCQSDRPRFVWQPACLISCQATVEGDVVNEPPVVAPLPQPKPKLRR